MEEEAVEEPGPDPTPAWWLELGEARYALITRIPFVRDTEG